MIKSLRIFVVILTCLFLVIAVGGCGTAEETQIIATQMPSTTSTITTAPTETATLTPTLTLWPTATITLTPTITPPPPAGYTGPLPEGVVARLGKGRFTSLAASPDGSLLAIASSVGVYVFDAQTLVENHFLATDYPVTDVAWSNDGSLLAVGSPVFDQVTLWDSFNGVQVQSLPIGPVTALDWSPGGQFLVTGNEDNVVSTWQVDSGELIESFFGHKPVNEWATGITSVDWFASDKIFSTGIDGRRIVWDAQTGEMSSTIDIPASADFYKFSISPDGRFLAGFGQFKAALWSMETGAVIKELEDQHVRISQSVAWSSGGTKLAVGAQDNSLFIWDIHEDQLTKVFQAHEYGINSVAWLDNDTRLAGIGSNLLVVWDVAAGKEMYTLRGSGSVEQIAWSPDGQTLAGLHDGTIVFWNVESRHPRFSVDILKPIYPNPAYGWITRIGYSPDGNIFAIVYGDDGSIVRFLDAHTGKKFAFTLDDYPVDFSWSPDQAIIAVTSRSAGPAIEFWDVIAEREINAIGEGSRSIIAWSPDGSKIASSSGSSLEVINLSSKEVIATLPKEYQLGDCYFVNQAHCFSWSPNNTKLVLGTHDGQVLIWDIAANNVDVLGEGRGNVLYVDWSSDGGLIAAAWSYSGLISGPTRDGDEYKSQLVLFDAETGERVLSRETLSPINDLAFSPDSSLLALATADGTIWLMEP
ncbi:MAG: WD40 repeat domain-containing protein [Anaerolineales bacterium]|nr:WD40 repeat domain-containing protein [Anaerolineales bacterium]